MKERKVLAYENMPTRLPIWTSATAWLLMDRLNSSGWVWGAVGTIFAFLWVVCIIDICREKRIKMWESSESEPVPTTTEKT